MIVMMPTLMIQILRRKRHTGSPARGDHNPENLYIKSFPLLTEKWNTTLLMLIMVVTLVSADALQDYHRNASSWFSFWWQWWWWWRCDDDNQHFLLFNIPRSLVHSYETSFLNIVIFFKNISAQFPEKLVKRIWRILQFRIFQSVDQASKDVDWVIVSQFDKIIPS